MHGYSIVNQVCGHGYWGFCFLASLGSVGDLLSS